MPDEPTFDARLAARPDLAGPLADLVAALRAGPLEPELLDDCERLVRHRIGVSGGAPPDVGAADLDPRRRAVLLMAEQFVMDPHGIDDAMRDAVLDHCTLAELSTLVQALAVFDALARMEAVLGEDTTGAVGGQGGA
jgi:hypothetical protein